MAIVVGVTGEMASGKDTVTEYLVEKYGAKKYRFSDILREILDLLFVPQTRENLTRLSILLRQGFGDDLLAKVIEKRAEDDKTHPILVIDGIRRYQDIAYFNSLDGFTLWYVDASFETRYERLTMRSQNVDDMTKSEEEFRAEHEFETEKTVPALKEHANEVINNEGMLDELHRKVDVIMAKLGVN
ncbi:MAG: AAA family ATPase [Candidatus Moranbacteria bacterium]|nr:AAA family ATPase [Candidatus Moranbacteria bacterium]